MKSMRRVVTGAVVGLLLVSACGDSDAASDDTPTSVAAAESAGLEVDGAWARASPMMASAGAVYLTVDNPGSVDDVLVGVSVAPGVAATAELHETSEVAMDDDSMDHGSMDDDSMDDDSMDHGSMDDDSMDDGNAAPMMQMSPVESITVPAGGSVVLEPGGYHVMLLDLVEPLSEGDTVDVTLVFEDAGEMVITADVRSTAP